MTVIALGLALVIAQSVEIPPDAQIRLQRTQCFGSCPVYSVTIDAHGVVTYEGASSVRVVGPQVARIPPSSVAALLMTADHIQFFDLRDAYRCLELPDGRALAPSTDLPTQIVTITVNGRTKRVEDYEGAPPALTDFERLVDDTARTKRWVFLDGEALDGLVHAGWSASDDEGARLLQEAVRRDDVPIAHRLIELGAKLERPESSRFVLLLAARSKAMVDLLVAAGADPNERLGRSVTTQTPLMATAYKDAAVAEALLTAGARLEDLEDGRSALWYAACRGNWRVVALLLHAGANARGAADIPAVECARRGRETALNLVRDPRPMRPPAWQDFDQVIALLENADRRRDR